MIPHRRVAVRVVVGLILVMVVVAGTGTEPGRADTPALDVFVDGDEVSSGDEFSVRVNPELRIEASAAEPLETVSVRVNGRTTRTVSPNSTTVSTSFTLQLEDNQRNTVRVLVQDAGGGTESMRFTVTKDNVAPFVGFESPFRTEVQSRPPETHSTSNSSLTFAGTLADTSGVRTVKIERRHRYTRVGETRIAAQTTQLSNPGEQFSADIFVGYGTNIVRFTMIDTLGNQRSYEFTIEVEDDTRPRLSISDLPRTVRRGSVLIGGSATDNTQVDEVTYSVEGRVRSATLVSSVGPAANSERKSVSYEQEVSLNPGENSIRVEATDLAGNTASEEITVVYNDTDIPELTLANVTPRNGSVGVSAAVRYGSYRRVSIETVDTATADIVDFTQVYDGDPVERNLIVNESLLTAETGQTKVVLRVTDADGTEHRKSVVVGDSTTETTSPTSPESETPTVTETVTVSAEDTTAVATTPEPPSTPGTGAPTVATRTSGPTEPLLPDIDVPKPRDRDRQLPTLLVTAAVFASAAAYLREFRG